LFLAASSQRAEFENQVKPSLNRLLLTALLTMALFCDSCAKKHVPAPFIEAVIHADRVVVLEGLPHQAYERELLEQERRTKKTQERDSYPFYEEPLEISEADAGRLTKLLGSWATYKPAGPPPACGGFHPDYAVEFYVGADRYMILICFHCNMVDLTGPSLESHNVLDFNAYEQLKKLLTGYRKNRPSSSIGD
jgi:hypothetical protein